MNELALINGTNLKCPSCEAYAMKVKLEGVVHDSITVSIATCTECKHHPTKEEIDASIEEYFKIKTGPIHLLHRYEKT